MDLLHRIQAVVILDHNGQRIFAKYYVGEDLPESFRALANVEKQKMLEQSIFTTIAGSTRVGADITVADGHAVLYRREGEVTFVVLGDEDENALVLQTVLTALVDALKELLHEGDFDTRMLLEAYEAILLVVDELLDDGIILETSASSLAAEVKPYLVESTGDTARHALSTVNQYLRENL